MSFFDQRAMRDDRADLGALRSPDSDSIQAPRRPGHFLLPLDGAYGNGARSGSLVQGCPPSDSSSGFSFRGLCARTVGSPTTGAFQAGPSRGARGVIGQRSFAGLFGCAARFLFSPASERQPRLCESVELWRHDLAGVCFCDAGAESEHAVTIPVDGEQTESTISPVERPASHFFSLTQPGGARE